MNQAVSIATLSALLCGTTAHGQGTFIYDQQSAKESTGGGAASAIQDNQPLGQSFTPTRSSVGFIRLALADYAVNGIGAAMYLNLRADSISGPILGSTEPVIMEDGFREYPNFLFPAGVPVASGTTYYFEPVISLDSDIWGIRSYNYNYPDGIAYGRGLPDPSVDLWFREGIIVPETSAAFLALIGAVGLVVRCVREKAGGRSASQSDQ